MKKQKRPLVPNKAKRMVREYQSMGYILSGTSRCKCLISLRFNDLNKPSPKVNNVYILAYTSEGKVHPLAGMSLMNREKS